MSEFTQRQLHAIADRDARSVGGRLRRERLQINLRGTGRFRHTIVSVSAPAPAWKSVSCESETIASGLGLATGKLQ